ncbi:MAG TPA: hypothetical protein VN132_03300, partial [Bdellovibrio sp.]|nr:hypothetical protein [Bdellovibrio sp.]
MIDGQRHRLFVRFRKFAFICSLLLTAYNSGSQAKEVTLPDETIRESAPSSTDTSLNSTAFDKVRSMVASDRAAILSKYNYLDSQHQVPTKALEDAVIYWDQNKVKFGNVNYITIINFAQNSKEKRFYIVDMNKGGVWA